jgi:hypothetical protein
MRYRGRRWSWLVGLALVSGLAQAQVPGQPQVAAPRAAPAPAAAPTQVQAPSAAPPAVQPATQPTPPAQPQAVGQDGCIKQVFGLYCLGADANALLRQRPPTSQERDGERLALIYDQGTEQDFVMSFRGRVYKVVRQFRIETQLKYQDIYAQLREKYGAGEDRSLFPSYAETPASRQGSIRRGDGKAIHVWAPAENWRIELTWTREFGLSLAYVDNALEAQQRAAVQRGL